MAKEILIHIGIAEFRFAVVNDGVLERYRQESTIGREGRGAHSGVGDLVLGRVGRVLPGINAAFIDIGMERAGFLAAGDARRRDRDTAGDVAQTPLRIGDCVREGETVLVQIIKDPMGEKGARVSMSLSLAGRLLVLVPDDARVSVSRRIADDGERARLADIGASLLDDRTGTLAPGAGYILRTASIGASAQDLLDDAKRLAETWRAVTAARAQSPVPTTVYRDLGPVERALRDDVDADVRRIVIDDPGALETARAYCRLTAPAMTERLEGYADRTPLFENHGIEDDIAALASSRVTLPSGGWITIETTEALTAIDVNSGRHIGAGDLEETSFAVNREAADAVGRHLDLRGIGGLIVIDFIHLSDPGNVERVTDILRVGVARAHVPAEISSMSAFGLVAITRKRERESLNMRLTEACGHCDGHGRRKTIAASSLDVLRHVERAAAAAPGREITAHAAPEIVAWLEAHADDVSGGLSRRGAGRMRLMADSARGRESFMVETG